MDVGIWICSLASRKWGAVSGISATIAQVIPEYHSLPIIPFSIIIVESVH